MDLRETFYSEDLTESRVDAAAFVIRNVRVLGATSRNGRIYSEAAMRQAVGLYEGARLNFNHLDRRDAGKERHFEDWVGEIRNVHYVPEEKSLRGDAHILESDPRSAKLMEAARRFPRSFGLSHVASGVEVKRGSDRVVEKIESVASVDIVTTPATNVGLFESEEPVMARKKTHKQSVKQLMEQAPDSPFVKVFTEMMDMGAMPVEAEVEAPEEASPEDAMKEAAISAITAKIATASADEIAGLLQALGMDDSISDILGGGGSSEAPAEAPAEESVKTTERLNLIESENLLLKANREATPERVQAVALMPPDARKKLVESWPAKQTIQESKRPQSSPPARSQSGSSAVKAIEERWTERAKA